jgi:hypothetical protein
VKLFITIFFSIMQIFASINSYGSIELKNICSANQISKLQDNKKVINIAIVAEEDCSDEDNEIDTKNLQFANNVYNRTKIFTIANVYYKPISKIILCWHDIHECRFASLPFYIFIDKFQI